MRGEGRKDGKRAGAGERKSAPVTSLQSYWRLMEARGGATVTGAPPRASPGRSTLAGTGGAPPSRFYSSIWVISRRKRQLNSAETRNEKKETQTTANAS